MLEDGDEDVVLIAAKRDRDFKRLVGEFAGLRAAGIRRTGRAAANPNGPEALDKGFLEGLAGMGQGAAALYSASQLNPNGAQRDRARGEMGKGLKQAWENPGQFGKSLIDWDDLSTAAPTKQSASCCPASSAASLRPSSVGLLPAIPTRPTPNEGRCRGNCSRL